MFKLKYVLVYINFRLQVATFDLPFTLTSDRVLISSVVLLDSEHMNIPVEKSVLLCIQAEIHVILYLLPVVDYLENLGVAIEVIV